MAIIEGKNIEKIYIDGKIETPALRGVSLNIEKGEFVAIMGPSGSGKSTLLHILGFLDRHTRGEYRFEGKTFDELSQEEVARTRNKKMGFVFQTFNLLARTTVFENVRLPLLYSDIPDSEWRERTDRAIKSVGLSHRSQYKTSQLSGGERQRVAIARALVNTPDVIFADEPTGNLDSVSGKMIMEILQRLNEEEGHTILLITHETYTAEHARRIIHILDGRVDSDTRVNNRHVTRDRFRK